MPSLISCQSGGSTVLLPKSGMLMMRQLQAPSETFVTGRMSSKRPAPAIVFSPTRKSPGSVITKALAMFIGIHQHQCQSYGHSCLGSPLCSPAFINKFVSKSAITHSQSPSAFAALTHGTLNKWTYLSHTTAGIITKSWKILQFQLIPAIKVSPAHDDLDRQCFALPAREGGLGIINPASSCEFKYSASKAISEPLSKAVLHCWGYSGLLLLLSC